MPDPGLPPSGFGTGFGFDFDAAVVAPFRMQPGLRRLAAGAAPQLHPLRPGDRHQREKLAVLGAFAPLALQSAPGFDAGPALRTLCEHAAAEHPGAWSWDGAWADARWLGCAVHANSGELHQHTTGSFGLGDEVLRCLTPLPAAWRLPGLLSLAFAEDFAVVDGRDGTIPWLAVTLPSHWAPEQKIGRHFAEVHGPVADNDMLLRASAALVKLATGAERWERFVWNVSAHARLHAHPAHVDPARWGGRFDASTAWWRTERQTFIPLPAHQQALFTIAVDVQPLQQALRLPGRAAKLQAALASMSPAVLDYRGLTPVRESILAWLASVDLATSVPSVPSLKARA